MATVKATLLDGLTIGEKKHTAAELREYTAGDLIDAVDAGEKLVPMPDGPALVVSPSRVDLELLCRQIVRIGEHKGPLSLSELRRLSGRDLAALQSVAKQLDAGASISASAQRGRVDGSEGER